MALKSFLTMDAWLATIESDQRDVPLSQKVLDDKPTGAFDECFMGATLTETTDAAACDAAFPYFADARLVAGSPWTDNATQCSLQPLDRASYSVAFTDAQWARCPGGVPGRCLRLERRTGRLPAVDSVAHLRRRPRRRAVGPAPESHPGSANH